MSIFGKSKMSDYERQIYEQRQAAKARRQQDLAAENAKLREANYQRELASLQREAAIEEQRARIARAQAGRGAARTQAIREGFKSVQPFTSPVRSLTRGVGAVGGELLSGVKALARKRGSPPGQGRAVYMSTSHGLKRVYLDNYGQPIQSGGQPVYNRQSPVEPRPIRIKTEDDDWGEQASAFSKF